MLKSVGLFAILGLLIFVSVIETACNRCDYISDPAISAINLRVENRLGQNLIAGPNRLADYNNITLSYRAPSNGLTQTIGFSPTDADTNAITFYPPSAGFYFFSSSWGSKVDTLGVYIATINSRCNSSRKIHRVDLNSRELKISSKGYYTIVK